MLMKRIILIRHAKSSNDDPSMGDWDRPLNERGMRDAPRMGAALRDHTPLPGSFFCSSAKRAATTARLLAKSLGFDVAALVERDDLYTFDDRSLLSAIHAFPSDDDCVALVGHNPACHILCETLTRERIDKYVTCGTAILDAEVDIWRKIGPGTCSLKAFLKPAELS